MDFYISRWSPDDFSKIDSYYNTLIVTVYPSPGQKWGEADEGLQKQNHTYAHKAVFILWIRAAFLYIIDKFRGEPPRFPIFRTYNKKLSAKAAA